jgi:hypothetical protein
VRRIINMTALTVVEAGQVESWSARRKAGAAFPDV